jgi:hypothetical protein
MDSDGKKVKCLTIILREVDYEDDQKTYGGIVYQQTLVNAKLQIGKRGQKQSCLGGSALDWSAIEEEEEEEEER